MKKALPLCVAIVCLTGPVLADRLDGLVKRSPFAPDKAVAVGAAPTVAPSRVEFGGYMVLDGKPLVSLCDTATGQSVWVGLKDAAAAYFVESFDAAIPAVSVRLNGAAITLGLRKANTDVMPATATASSPAPAAATVNDPGATPAASGTPAETAAPKNRIPPQTLRIPKRVDDPA